MLKSPPANEKRTPRTANRCEDIEKGQTSPKPKPDWVEKSRSRSSSRENGGNKNEK